MNRGSDTTGPRQQHSCPGFDCVPLCGHLSSPRGHPLTAGRARLQGSTPHLVVQLPGPEGELHVAVVPRDVLGYHLGGVGRRGLTPRGPRGSAGPLQPFSTLQPSLWEVPRHCGSLSFVPHSLSDEGAGPAGAGGRQGLTVMVDLPAFLPNFSNSARVTFFWATICKSEGQGGSVPAPWGL